MDVVPELSSLDLLDWQVVLGDSVVQKAGLEMVYFPLVVLNSLVCSYGELFGLLKRLIRRHLVMNQSLTCCLKVWSAYHLSQLVEKRSKFTLQLIVEKLLI